jgi:hypothetical protein
VPRGWIEDPERSAAAGVPDQLGFATKPALAIAMLARSLDAGVPAAWWPAMRSTAPTLGCGPSWRPEASAMCWPWPATTGWSPPATATAPRSYSGGSRRGPGSAYPPAAAPKATATTTGRSSASTTTATTPHLAARLASAGCWWAATPGPASWPSTTAGRHARSRWPLWSGSPDAAGPSRSASRPARAWSAWTNSGPPLALLVPVDHPGHARPRLPRGARGRLPHPPPTTSRLISLTCNEVQHLFAALVSVPVGDLEHRRRWSVWRRRHQARARTCHYQRQATRP